MIEILPIGKSYYSEDHPSGGSSLCLVNAGGVGKAVTIKQKCIE